MSNAALWFARAPGHDIRPRLRSGESIDRGRRIPLGIQVVVGSLEWPCGRPGLVQETREVARIGC